MVDVRRFKLPGLGGFVADITREGQAAARAGRPADQERLRALWLDYIEVQLPALGDAKLIDYLETRPIWREEGGWPVYRLPGEPCIAFTASVLGDGSVELIALAACDRLPGGTDEQWWQDVVQPRVQQL